MQLHLYQVILLSINSPFFLENGSNIEQFLIQVLSKVITQVHQNLLK